MLPRQPLARIQPGHQVLALLVRNHVKFDFVQIWDRCILDNDQRVFLRIHYSVSKVNSYRTCSTVSKRYIYDQYKSS